MKSIDPIHSQPTTVFPPPAPAATGPSPAATASRSAPRCRLALVRAEGSQPTGGELESLLRYRLRVAVLLVLVPFVYYFIKRWIDPIPNFYGAETLARAHVGFLVLAVAITALLWSKLRVTVRELRAVEVCLFGMTTGFFALMQYNLFCMERVCTTHAGSPEVIRLAVTASAIRWFFLIVIYGVFIPNTWKRCAFAACFTAVLPILLTAAAAVEHDRFRETVSALSDMTILMGVAVAVAVFGSYRIQALQQQAQEARQLGQYRLKRRLGAGGMGEVYLAEHLLLRRPCAVKVIRPEHAADAKSLQRFEREVRAMATLTHWNTVEIYDYGHTDDNTFYYVMEYLPGENLETLVERHGPLPPARAVHFLRQICGALREAHGIGLLHRDIKPSNVLACERGGVYDVAKLLDFGLVQGSGVAAAGGDRLTVIGAIVGSPPFMSPEQASGKPLDLRSDIYSVGTLAYYLLTGKPPFPRDTPMQMLMAHAYEPVPPLTESSGIPHDLEDVVRRCLEKEPANRWQDAAHLEKALAACACAGEWTEERAAEWWRRRPAESLTSPNLHTAETPVLAESPVPAG